MDDVLFSARRASAGAAVRTTDPEEPETRFRALVQSPLRAGLLRFLHGSRTEAFSVEALMQAFGRMRLDVENCIRELVDFGVASEVRVQDGPVQYAAARPSNTVHAELLDTFLERRAAASTEDQSPSVQRF